MTLTGNVVAAASGGRPAAATAAAWTGKLVSHHVLGGNLNALAKIATLFKVLWRTATCTCCKSWTVDDYKSAGSFHPAVSVKRRRQRDQRLQDTAAGEAKALGKRNHALGDTQRRGVCLSLLLEPTTAEQYGRNVNLNTVWVMQFALESRGATARELAWSDMSVRTFAGMFHDDGNPARLLCTYITATKTTEGITRCIGALPHVDPWVCPVGAIADALVEWCHRPGGTPSAPPVDFTPVFKPDDAELTAAGVTPDLFREAGNNLFFRRWYRILASTGPRGGRLKPMTYRHHSDRVRLLLMAMGVPDWMAKTHVLRAAAASMAKMRGVNELDNKDHGIWSVPIGGGPYENAIPNGAVVKALSGRRPDDVVAPTTPRLEVPVPEELQKTLCPWLEAEEKALSERVAANPVAQDEALKDLFDLIRWLRSVYFQTMAARLESTSIPPSAYINRVPLLQHPLFSTFREQMASTLSAAGEVAAAAVAQVIPPMAQAVRVAVEAVAAASTAETRAIEERLSVRIDAGVSAVNAHTDVGVGRVMTHTTAVGADIQSHMDARFDAMEQDLARQRELLARLLTDDILRDPRARALVRAELVRAPGPAAPTTATAQVLRSATEPAAPVTSPTPAPPICTQLLTDRRNVRTLQAAGKLVGVPIYESMTECVPLLTLAEQPNWGVVLDQYVNGVDGRVSLMEAQQLFGKRWRLCPREPAARRNVIKTFSERSHLHRAFDVEYARRGHAVGKDRILRDLKAKFPAEASLKAVLSRAKREYPVEKGGECL